MNKYRVIVFPKIYMDVYAKSTDEAEYIAQEKLEPRLKGLEVRYEEMDTQEIEGGMDHVD